jgi:hypothetical protein
MSEFDSATKASTGRIYIPSRFVDRWKALPNGAVKRIEQTVMTANVRRGAMKIKSDAGVLTFEFDTGIPSMFVLREWKVS